MSLSYKTVFKYEHCYQAAKAGDLEELTQMFEAGFPLIHEEDYEYDGDIYPRSHSTSSWAAKNGHLDCLKFAHENGCEWDWSTTYFAANGHLDCLKYAHENGCPWDEWTTSIAAEEGHIHCLIYAFENGCPSKNKKQILKRINEYKQKLKIVKNNLENYLSSDLINHVINKYIL